MTRGTAAGARWVIAELGLAGASAVVSLTVAVVALRVSIGDVAQRWTTGGADQVLHYEIFASALDVFPFAPNDRLGFPEAQNLFFAPLFDLWSALFVRAAALFGADGVWALNLYDLGGFAAVGFTSYIFFRALKVRRPTALVFGVVFATVPYHFVQLAIGHPFLANYWAVPLAGVLVLMAGGEQTDPFAAWAGRASTRRGRFWRRAGPLLVLVPAVAFTQSYYFVFAALVVAAVWAVGMLAVLVGGGDSARLRRRARLRALVWPTVTTAALLVLVGAQLAVLSLNLGDRYEKYFGTRSFTESEFYGGKLIDLLLPSRHSGILPLAHRAQYYADTSGLLKTSESASTAVVASAAIVLCGLLLVVRLLRSSTAPDEAALATTQGTEPAGRPRGGVVQDARVGVLLVAFVVALMFFVTAGLGTVLAFFVSPEIRAWSRMSIVVSMLALGVFAVVLDRLVRRRWLLFVALIVIAGVAALDQVPRISRTLPLAPVADVELKQFTAGVEDALAPRCGVVVLPLKGFPESGPIGRMGDYDEALLYLYADHRAGSDGDDDADLRWSDGAVTGTTSGDFWKNVTTPTTFAAAVATAEPCGIVVDSSAYSDDPEGWKPLVRATGVDPAAPDLVSAEPGTADHRYLLFELPVVRPVG